MEFKRFTKQNHNEIHPSLRVTYHVPMSRVTDFEMKTFGRDTFMYGEIANQLGKYEDLGTPEEIARKLGIKCAWNKG